MSPLPDEKKLRRRAAEEAVAHLGLLKGEAVATVFELLDNPNGLHPRAICTAYRKKGEQLHEGEKKVAGLRKNAFMSREALAEITAKGMQDPLRAHELTVLRGSFAIFRHRHALSAEHIMQEHPNLPIEVQYDVFHPDSCDVCNALYRKPVGPDWGLFAPNGCTCITAPYGLHIRADFIGEVLAEEEQQRRSEKPTLFERIRQIFGQPLHSA
jgi:hypothetical protein